MPRPRSKPWPPEPNQTASGKPGAIQVSVGDSDEVQHDSGGRLQSLSRSDRRSSFSDTVGRFRWVVEAAAARAGLPNEVSAHWRRYAHASVATTGRYLHARPAESSARFLGV
jgi:hypothetical protein